jgi:hypothetical protein
VLVVEYASLYFSKIECGFKFLFDTPLEKNNSRKKMSVEILIKTLLELNSFET